MTTPDLPADFVARCQAVTAKRPRTVIDHILAHGYVTTEELRENTGTTTRHAQRATCVSRAFRWRPIE